MNQQFFQLFSNPNLLDPVIEDCFRIIRFGFFEIVKPPEKDSSFYWDAFLMVHKLLQHSISITSLSNGNEIVKENGEELLVLDKDSPLVLMRTVLENYLTFFSIYINPSNFEEREFRHQIYKFTEEKVIYDRLKVINSDPDFIHLNSSMNTVTDSQILSNENEIKNKRDYYEKVMTDNPLFKTLSTKQKNLILKKPRPDWKIDGSWYDLASKAKFKKSYFGYTYNMLSSSVHTGSQSIESHNLDGTYSLAYRALNLSTLMNLTIILSRCLLEYCDFTNTKETIIENNEIFELLKTRVLAGISVCIFEDDESLRLYLINYIK